MNGTGYSSAEKPSAQFFTKEQRQRLEALTVIAAIAPAEKAPGREHTWIRLADYIVTGES
jgi:hypothetical protein